MYLETFHKIRCEKCSEAYYVCEGDILNPIQRDIESVQCPYCDYVESLHGGHLEQSFVTQGVKVLE
jgi:NAD-dependent SIR2 family protein deacetylase